MHTTTLPPTATNIMTLGPVISTKVHLGLTITFTAVYALVFFVIFLQLLLILYYKHRRLSYQTFFLFTCLIWAALRTTLFSFYFKNSVLSNTLPTFFRWLLFAFPVYLQYNMLSVLLFYFLLVVVKVVSPSKLVKLKRKIFIAVIVSNIVFLVANISSSVLYSVNPQAPYQQTVTMVRVFIDYSLFLIAALLLCYCIIKLTRQTSAKLLLEGQGVSMWQAMLVCILIALLYSLRAIYNILAVSPLPLPTFGFGWINVSDQGEVGYDGLICHTTDDRAFLSFGMVLFFWELLPTAITLWFFRVRKPEGVTLSTSTKSDSYRHFFDDPDRYNSDEDLSISYSRSTVGGSLPDIPHFGSSPSRFHRSVNREERSSIRKVVSSYGSVPPYNDSFSQTGGQTASFPNVHVRGTTPPLLFNKTIPVGGSYDAPSSPLLKNSSPNSQPMQNVARQPDNE